MKKILLQLVFVLGYASSYASVDTCIVPFQRIRFHDRINEEQSKFDKADGKLDNLVKVSNNEEINLQVTFSVIDKVDSLQCFVENSPKIISNNEKVRNLTYIEEVVRSARIGWKSKEFNPVQTPMLIEEFEKILKANLDSVNMVSIVQKEPYEIANILVDIFKLNAGYKESKKLVYLKYVAINPDKIITTISPYADEKFADSLIVVFCLRNPVQLYSYAQAVNSPEGKLIRRNENPIVKKVVELTQTPKALFYFPFLDNILSGKLTIDSIKTYVGNDDGSEQDSVGYYKLLVNTEIEYYKRLVKKDTAIAMFGANGLRDMLKQKAIQHFITPINTLHEENNLNIRMKALNPLTAQEIYFMMVLGEDDIYTSSYKHSFERMIQKMGAKPRADSLLMSVNLDFFKRFIKMAANFNQLDTFLRLMPNANSQLLMKAFVAKLDNTTNLEDAVDVADSYSSIKDEALLKTILQNVQDNEQKCILENNSRGKTIYGLLKTIFLSADNPEIDLTTEIGIPSIYSVDANYLSDDSGRIVQQVFFYGDEDGKNNFNGFINSFSPTEWRITKLPEWVEIKSLKGKRVWIYANKPLDNDANLDDTAQAHLGSYLVKNKLSPSVVIHRGHSYWLPGTIDRMPGDVKIIVLGSCGGYKNLNQILSICPDAHIISTKEIGKGDINRPILNYLNQVFISGKTLDWKEMWTSLTKVFSKDPSKDVRDSWDNYIPPYKNLGAVFIKAYNKQMEGQLGN